MDLINFNWIKPVMYIKGIPVYIDQSIPVWLSGYIINIPEDWYD